VRGVLAIDEMTFRVAEQRSNMRRRWRRDGIVNHRVNRSSIILPTCALRRDECRDTESRDEEARRNVDSFHELTWEAERPGGQPPRPVPAAAFPPVRCRGRGRLDCPVRRRVVSET